MTDFTSWKGQDVFDPTGDTIGRIEDIYLDEQTGAPEWLAVRTGLVGRRVSFVPLAEAQPTGDALAVPYTKDQVTAAPHIEPDGVLSEQEKALLYDYYNLPYSDRDSETGLPAAAAGYDAEADPAIAGQVTHEEPGSWGSVTSDRAGPPANTIQGGAA